jgi:preprotein translocase SecE subunit
MTSLLKFFKDSWQELKQVTWLTRPQMIASTWLVIFLVIIFSIYVGVMDAFIAFLFGKIIS